MRTIYPLVVSLALIVASMMVGLSGFAAIVGQDDRDELQGSSNLSESADDADDVDTSVLGLDNPLAGLVVTGLDSLVSFAGFVVLLPINLSKLGFPEFFAYPIGLIAQAIIGIGLFEALSGRELT